MQQTGIRSGKFVRRQFVTGYPFQRCAADRLRLTLTQPTEKEFQANGFFRVRMGYVFEQRTDFNLNTQFLVKFAGEATVEGFARFALATGEFPQAAEMSISVTLGDEEFAGTEDQASADFDDIAAHPKRASEDGLPPDALVNPTEFLHLFAVKEISAIEHDRVRQALLSPI